MYKIYWLPGHLQNGFFFYQTVTRRLFKIPKSVPNKCRCTIQIWISLCNMWMWPVVNTVNNHLIIELFMYSYISKIWWLMWIAKFDFHAQSFKTVTKNRKHDQLANKWNPNLVKLSHQNATDLSYVMCTSFCVYTW